MSSAVKYTEPCRSVSVKLPILTNSYPTAGAVPVINEAETDERYLRKIDTDWEKGKITDSQHTKLEKLMFKKSRLFKK